MTLDHSLILAIGSSFSLVHKIPQISHWVTDLLQMLFKPVKFDVLKNIKSNIVLSVNEIWSGSCRLDEDLLFPFPRWTSRSHVIRVWKAEWENGAVSQPETLISRDEKGGTGRAGWLPPRTARRWRLRCCSRRRHYRLPRRVWRQAVNASAGAAVTEAAAPAGACSTALLPCRLCAQRSAGWRTLSSRRRRPAK